MNVSCYCCLIVIIFIVIVIDIVTDIIVVVISVVVIIIVVVIALSLNVLDKTRWALPPSPANLYREKVKHACAES